MATTISCTNDQCSEFEVPKTYLGGDWPEDRPTLCGVCGTHLLGPPVEAGLVTFPLGQRQQLAAEGVE